MSQTTPALRSAASSVVLLVGLLLALPGTAAGQNEARRACAVIDDPDDRVECYAQLGVELLDERSEVRRAVEVCMGTPGPIPTLTCHDGIAVAPFLEGDYPLAQDVRACASEDDPLRRLDCYDEVVPTTRMLDMVGMQSEQSELSYAAVRDNSPPTILEGRIAPHVFLNENRGKVGLEITPKVRLRIFRANSSPVRSPSFMPRITLYFVPDGSWDGADRRPGTFLSARISHHSNGQDGPFFSAPGVINTVDGSFSTNFAELGVHRFFFPQSGIIAASLSYEGHLWFNQEPELDGIYSEHRLNTRLDYTRGGLLKEIDFDLVLMLDEVAGWSRFDSRRANWEVTARFAWLSLQDTSLFAKVYWGQDYYNMRFNDRVKLLQVGLTVDFFTWAPVN